MLTRMAMGFDGVAEQEIEYALRSITSTSTVSLSTSTKKSQNKTLETKALVSRV